MSVEKIERFKIPPRWLFLKMTTEDGIVKFHTGLRLVNFIFHYLSGLLIGTELNNLNRQQRIEEAHIKIFKNHQ